MLLSTLNSDSVILKHLYKTWWYLFVKNKIFRMFRKFDFSDIPNHNARGKGQVLQRERL